MPPQCQLSIDTAVEECREIHSLGIGGVILFGLPESKDEEASGAYDDQGIVQRAIRAIKREVPDLLVITDVCNCEYTSHGHCGKIVDGDVDNDATLEWLAEAAVSHARAGADIVAPSDMMDGRVAAIRAALDAERLHEHRRSCPMRRSSLPCFTGRSARRPNPRRSSATGAAIRWTRPTAREAMREIELDLEEGADMIMVKPAMPYLDLIRAGARPLSMCRSPPIR